MLKTVYPTKTLFCGVYNKTPFCRGIIKKNPIWCNVNFEAVFFFFFFFLRFYSPVNTIKAVSSLS